MKVENLMLGMCNLGQLEAKVEIFEQVVANSLGNSTSNDKDYVKKIIHGFKECVALLQHFSQYT